MTDNTPKPRRSKLPFHIDVRAFPWTSLRTIGNNPTLRMTIFIPLIGYLVIFNEYLVHYLDLAHQIFGTPEAQSSPEMGSHLWRLLLIYFGLCCLAVASAIYQLCCPPEIKAYSTANDYIAATGSNLGHIAFGRLESRLSSRPSSSTEFGQLQQMTLTRDHSTGDRAHRDQIWEQHRLDVLELNYRSLNVSRRPARIAAFTFYGLGLGFLLIPSLNVFWKVATAALFAMGALLGWH